jgi:hypothetical protein
VIHKNSAKIPLYVALPVVAGSSGITLEQAASVADRIFRERPSRRVPEPVWSAEWPLLFCAETARYYHRLFAAT